MSEETLHVNEFEKDTKPVYRSERNLQQRYKPFVAVRWAEPVFAYFFMTGKGRIPWKKLKEIE